MVDCDPSVPRVGSPSMSTSGASISNAVFLMVAAFDPDPSIATSSLLTVIVLVLTAVIVSQLSVGLSPKASFDYLVGTLAGAVVLVVTGGEALYAVNYNSKEKSGSSSADGKVDAADALRMFPQGHGDAYGRDTHRPLRAGSGRFRRRLRPSRWATSTWC